MGGFFRSGVGDFGKNLFRVFVTGLNAFKVKNSDTTHLTHFNGEFCVNHTVHSGRENRHIELYVADDP